MSLTSNSQKLNNNNEIGGVTGIEKIGENDFKNLTNFSIKYLNNLVQNENTEYNNFLNIKSQNKNISSNISNDICINKLKMDENINKIEFTINDQSKFEDTNFQTNCKNSISPEFKSSDFPFKERNETIQNEIEDNIYDINKIENTSFKFKSNQNLNVKEINLNNTKIDLRGPKIFHTLSEAKNRIDENKKKNKQCTLDLFQFKVPNKNFNKNKKMKELQKDTLLKIYSWNVNGFRKILEENILIDFLNKENPDILCLNETKIDYDSLIKEKYFPIIPENYGSFWNCSKNAKGYSGVAVFTKYHPISHSYGIGIEEHDQEGRIITLEYEFFYLIIAYVPNSGLELKRLNYRINHWDKNFYEFIYNLSKTKNIILAGDLNVLHKDPDLLNGKRYNEFAGGTILERENFDRFLRKGFIDAYKHFYQIKESSWFDYFILDEKSKDKILDCNILIEYTGSDHYPIKLIYQN